VPNRRLPSVEGATGTDLCSHRIEARGLLCTDCLPQQVLTEATGAMDLEGGRIIRYHHDVEVMVELLLGSRLTIHTDCKCLEYLAKYQDTRGKLGRWCSYMSMFKYELVWCAGCENGCADWLSRAPLSDTY
jgi:hypothetical protein